MSPSSPLHSWELSDRYEGEGVYRKPAWRCSHCLGYKWQRTKPPATLKLKVRDGLDGDRKGKNIRLDCHQYMVRYIMSQ